MATVITDKETKGVTISIYYKKQKTQVKTLKDYRQVLLQRLYTGMLRQRLSEVELASNAPFLSATAGIGKFLGNMDSYFLKAALKEDKVNEGIEALLEESERAKRFGFTPSELERYKSLLLNNADLYRKESGKVSNMYYVEQWIDHFTDNKPVPGEAFVYDFYNDILPGITVNEVNNLANEWLKDENIVIVINAIEKEGLNLPSEVEVLKMLSASKTEKIEAYEENLITTKLMDEKPSPGTVLKTYYNQAVDVTTWEFANGVTVIAKPTPFQNNLISMLGFRPGGSSNAPDSLYVSARYAGSIVAGSGINNISRIELNKLNMGKTVKVAPSINFYEELFTANSSTPDLESMLQMVHLYFTAPNKDEDVFNAYKEQSKSIAKDQGSSPTSFFDKRISEVMTQNHLRGVSLTEQQIEDELHLDEVYHFYKDRFSSANGFIFIFAGNFEIKALKQFATQYLGSLPSNLKEISSWQDIGLRRPKGLIKKTIEKGVDEKSKVVMNFTGELDYSPKKRKELTLLAKLLKIKLTEELREKMSGVYGVLVSGFANDKPYQWYRMSVQFTCAPDNTEKLIEKVFEEINKIKANGATNADLNKIKEAELANAKVNLKSNGFWIGKLKTAVEFNLNYEDILNYDSEINNLDSGYFRDAANYYFDANNYAEFILVPEK